MSKYERQQELLRILREKSSASVKDLAKHLYTSEASIRRDVEDLEKKGFLYKAYGSVILSDNLNNIVPWDVRAIENSSAKENVARKASELVFDGAVMIFDNSSTVFRMIKYMNNFNNLKIITNSLNIITECSKYKNLTLYSTGGKYNPLNRVFVGSAAENYIRSVNADIMFFSSQAISQTGEITDVSEDETSIRKVMMEHASRRIFLCDSSKIGSKKTFLLCGKNDVDEIICDTPLPWN